MLVVLAACGGNGNGAIDSAASTTVRVPSEEELRKALLTVGDLPSGFVEEPSTGDDDDDPGICQQFDIDAQVPSLAEVEVLFSNDSTSLYGAEAIAVYSLVDAQRYMTELGNVFVKCGEFTDVEEDGSTTNGAITGIAFPTYGDETTALSIEAEGAEFAFTLYSVIVRVENLVVGITFGGAAAPDVGVVQALVDKAVRKVETVL